MQGRSYIMGSINNLVMLFVKKFLQIRRLFLCNFFLKNLGSYVNASFGYTQNHLGVLVMILTHATGNPE